MQIKELTQKIQDWEVLYVDFFKNILNDFLVEWEDYAKVFQEFKQLRHIKRFSVDSYQHFQSFKNTQNIQSLDLRNYGYGDITFPFDFESLPELRNLSIRFLEKKTISDELFKATKLEELIFEKGWMEAHILNKLDTFTYLKSLKLQDKILNITESDIDRVFELTQLEYLNIRGFHPSLITEKITQMQNLKSIGFRAYSEYLPKILDYLGELSNLEYLETTYLRTLTDSLLKLQKLKEIDIALEQEEDFNYIMNILSKLSSLRKLRIRTSIEIPESILQVQQITAIEIIHMDALNIEKSFNLLARIPLLEEIKISIDANTEEKIFKNLAKLKNLKRLSIDFHSVSKNMQSFFIFLQKFEFLEYLEIKFYGIDYTITTETLPILNKLKKLKINSLPSSEINIKTYLYSLSRFPNLKELTLVGVDYLPDEMALLSNLEKLYIPYSKGLMLEHLKLKKMLPNTEVVF